MANGIVFSRILGKEDNFARYMYIKIIGNLLTGISVPFDFLLRISGIFG